MSDPGWRRSLSAHRKLIEFFEADERADEIRAAKDPEWALFFHRAQLGALRRGTTWSISADMVQLVSAASRSMPVETMLRSDPWTPSGVAWLEEPVWSPGMEGVRWPWRMVVWNTVEASDAMPHGFITLWAIATDADLLGTEPGGKRLVGTGFLPDFVPNYVNSWEFGSPTIMFEESIAPDPQPEDVRFAPFLKALWTIAAQPLAEVDRQRPAADAVRRAERAGIIDPTDVRVIRLRRPPSAPASASGTVTWSHQWFVNGYWRNTWIPSLESHRLQWVEGHVKGPKDKPLRLKQDVIDLSH